MSTERVGALSRIVIDLLRLIRTLREEYAALSGLLGMTLELKREGDRQLEAAQHRYLWLLAQHRALMSGRSNAEERQDLDETITGAPKAA